MSYVGRGPREADASHAQLELEGPRGTIQEGVRPVLLCDGCFIDWSWSRAGDHLTKVVSSLLCHGTPSGFVLRTARVCIAIMTGCGIHFRSIVSSEWVLDAAISPFFRWISSWRHWPVGMLIPDSSRDVVEEVRADKEGVQYSRSTVDPDQSELVSQANALRDMVMQGESKE